MAGQQDSGNEDSGAINQMMKVTDEKMNDMKLKNKLFAPSLDVNLLLGEAGLSLVARLRASSSRLGLIVLGLAEPEEMGKGYRSGVHMYLPRTFLANPLLRSLESLMGNFMKSKLLGLVPAIMMLGIWGTAQSAETTQLLNSGTSWNGVAIHYPEGAPNVTAVKIRLKNGEVTAIHCHPVPLFAYILKGQLRVTTGLGQSRVFKRGEAMVEVMDTWHQGKAVKGPVELIAFYAGVEGTPVSEVQGDGNSDCQP